MKLKRSHIINATIKKTIDENKLNFKILTIDNKIEFKKIKMQHIDIFSKPTFKNYMLHIEEDATKI